MFRSASAEGAQLSRDAGDLYTLEIWLMNQGFAALTGGDRDDPGPLLTEALTIADRIDDRVAQFYLVGALGCHAAASGDPRLAAVLLGASESLRAETGAQINPILAPLLPRAAAAASTALGPSTFETQFTEGTQHTRDAAIRLALGEPTHPPLGPPDDRPTPLSQREAEIARLVAAGLTNRQIGTRLFISERTVENHVRNIMNKTGFNSRTQIASWIAAPDQTA